MQVARARFRKEIDTSVSAWRRKQQKLEQRARTAASARQPAARRAAGLGTRTPVKKHTDACIRVPTDSKAERAARTDAAVPVRKGVVSRAAPEEERDHVRVPSRRGLHERSLAERTLRIYSGASCNEARRNLGVSLAARVHQRRVTRARDAVRICTEAHEFLHEVHVPTLRGRVQRRICALVLVARVHVDVLEDAAHVALGTEACPPYEVLDAPALHILPLPTKFP